MQEVRRTHIVASGKTDKREARRTVLSNAGRIRLRLSPFFSKKKDLNGKENLLLIRLTGVRTIIFLFSFIFLVNQINESDYSKNYQCVCYVIDGRGYKSRISRFLCYHRRCARSCLGK